MSIQSEVTRISGNISNAYDAVIEKGGTVPAEELKNSSGLADSIRSIPTGGGLPALLGQYLPDGVMPSVGSRFEVKFSKDSTGGTLVIGKGAALFDGVLIVLGEPVEFTLSADDEDWHELIYSPETGSAATGVSDVVARAPLPDSSLSVFRKDIVALKVTGESYEIWLFSGTKSDDMQTPTAPALPSGDGAHYYPIAELFAAFSDGKIEDCNATSLVGTADTPYTYKLLS